MTDAPPPLAPSPPAGPRAVASRARALVGARLRAAAAAFARSGRRAQWIAGGVSAAAVTILVGGILIAQQGAAGAEAPAPPPDLSTLPIGPCVVSAGTALPGAAPSPAGSTAASASAASSAPAPPVTGSLDGGLVLEVLRERALGPDALYQVRQAFEAVPEWSALTHGRYVVAMRGDTGLVERLDLVVSADEAYHATLDPTGKLVGARGAPAARLCHANVRLGGDGLVATLDGAGLGADLAPALRAAFAGRADLDGRPGAELRVIARELLARDVAAGHDGFAVAELRIGDDGAGDTATVRAHGAAIDEAQRAIIDARLASIAWPEPVVPRGAPGADEEEAAAVDPEEDGPAVDPKLTVAEAANRTCSTRIVAGLSRQIIEESRCIDADAFVRVPPRKNLVASSTVFLYLEAPARDRLLKVLDAYPDVTMTVNSALRTVAQQVLLSKWGETRRCGVPLAAKPGESNHETGLALDVKEAATWRKPLEGAGFKWMGKKDPVHFDYAGPRAKDHRGLDVRAFQRLWTRNHPDDPLAETGKVDAKTKARLARSPAAGFPIGARCGD